MKHSTSPSPSQSPSRERWHRTTVEQTGYSGLVYTISSKTRTKRREEQLEKHTINFSEKGITNPIVARSLIALTEIAVITPTSLLKIVAEYGKPREEKNDTSLHDGSLHDVFLTAMPNLKQYRTQLDTLPLGNLLTDTISYIAPPVIFPSVFQFLDSFTAIPDQQAAIDAISAYVQYYRGTRELVLSKQQQIMTNPAFSHQSPNHLHSFIELQLGKESPEKTTDANLITNPSFRSFVGFFTSFLEAYHRVFPHAFQQSDAVAFDTTGKLTKIDTNTLWDKYLTEIESGITLTIDHKATRQLTAPYHTRRSTWTYHPTDERKLEREIPTGLFSRVVNQDFGNDRILVGHLTSSGDEIFIMPPGLCPAFEVGWIQENVT